MNHRTTTNRRRRPRTVVALLATLLVPGLLAPVESVLSSPPPITASDSPPAGLTYAIDLRSRRFTPERGIDLEGIRAARVGGVTDDVHYLLQLERIPTAAERALLATNGVNVLSYLTGTTYLASSRTPDLEELATLNGVRAALPFRPADKLEPALAGGDVPDYARQGTEQALVNVQLHEDVSVEDGADVIRSLGGRVTEVLETINGLVALIDAPDIVQLAARDEVAYVGAARPPLGPAVDRAKTAAGADPLRQAPYNLDGSGVTVMVFDSGTVHAHNALSGKVLSTDGDDPDAHATHVAGIIVAGEDVVRPGTRAGIAPGAKIRSHGEDGFAPARMLTDAGSLEDNVQAAIAAGGMDIVNMSLASNAYANPFIGCDLLGDYTQSAQIVDNLVRGSAGARFTFVEAAGNERVGENGCEGHNTISPPATAKNSIAVGSWTTTAGRVSTFSSLGPTDDGRIKPDLVAPGCHDDTEGAVDGILSLDETVGYTSKCGTSQATPIVSGSVALMLQRWKADHDGETPVNATIRALLVHTATSMGTSSAPTYHGGYGALNAQAFVDAATDRTKTQIVTKQIDNSVTHSYRFHSDGSAPPKVTLAWDDPAAAPQAGAGNLVNDLDVRLIAPGQTARQTPWTLNPGQPTNAAVRANNTRDNLEVVEAEQAAAGEWTVRVSGTRVASGPQPYSLILPPSFGVTPHEATGNEGNAGQSDLSFTISLSEPSTVPVTFDFTTESGTATSGTDFVPTSGTITLAPGERSATVLVPVNGDTDQEPSETLLLRLSNPTNAYLEKTFVHGYVLDDDQPKDYEVIALAGTGGDTADTGATPAPALTALGIGPSINDKGKVGFTGFWSGVEGVFIGSKARTYRHLSKGFTTTARKWGENVQINDHDVAITRDRTSGSPIPNRIRVWDVNGAEGCAGATTPCWRVAASGGTQEVPKSSPDFESVDPLPSISNAITSPSRFDPVSGGIDYRDGVAFKAQRGVWGVVAEPLVQTLGSAPNPFQQITSTNDSSTRPMIASTGEIVLRRALPSWAPNNKTIVGDVIVPSSFKVNGFMYKAVNVGFSDTTLSSEPATWPTTVGAQVTDRQITWENIGRHPAKAATPTVQEGEVVVKSGGNAETLTTIAGPGNGFTSVGRSPGISDDGRTITFFADLSDAGATALGTTSGVGVFAAVKIGDGSRKIVRIAGVSGNGKLDPGETYVDVDGNGRFDAGTETDKGPFGSFTASDMLERVVANATQDTLHSIGIAFLATDPSGVRNLFVTRLRFAAREGEVLDPANPHRLEVRTTRSVVKVGDAVKDLPGRVTSIAIWDPINDRQEGDVAFHVRTSETVDNVAVTREAIVRALAPKTPLLFLPGIAGSELYDRNQTFADRPMGEKLWLDPQFGYDEFLRHRLSLRPEDVAGRDIYAPDILRRISVGGVTPDVRDAKVYSPLVDALVDRAGYVEYQVPFDHPEYRTAAGCDLTQKASRADLFLLPYDWRLDNGVNAPKVAEYIGCIQRLYPGTEINVLTHSMGSLLGRRYVIDNPDNPINAMITLAAPWLGATKLPYVLETGDFAPPVAPTPTESGQGIRYAVQAITAAHQLSPSRSFFDLGGRPMGEDGKDEDLDGIDQELYTFDQFKQFEDLRYPFSTPGTTADSFHSHSNGTNAQDDWRADSSGITYHHLYAVQSAAKTIGQVLFQKTLWCRSGLGDAQICQREFKLKINKVLGDGTVPEISASRKGMALDLNAPDATLHPFVAGAGDDNFYFDHNGMVANTKVLTKVLELLDAESPRTRSSVAAMEGDDPVASGGAFREADLLNISGLRLADDQGNSTDDILPGFPGTVPGVSTYVLSDDGRNLVFGPGGTYTAQFVTTPEPASVLLQTSDGTATSELVTWRDLDLPAGRKVTLSLFADGSETLTWDADGDGTAESDVLPTTTANGQSASDTDGPTITPSTSAAGNLVRVTLAADDPSNVTSLRYSTDGSTYLPYTAPFTVDPDDVSVVSAYAEDGVGNRSNLLEIPIEVLNRPPTADAVTATSVEDDATGAPIALTGSDPDGDAITFEVVDTPLNGTLTGTAPNLTYVPAANFHGTDTFTYRALDASSNSEPATVTITVTPVNDAPTAAADTAAVAEDGTVLVDVLGNDTTGAVGAPESGQALTIASASTPSSGTTAVEAGKVRYTPGANATGPDSFTYHVCDDGVTGAVPGTPDPKCATGTVNVTRTPVNDAPTAAADSYTTAEDAALVVAAPGLLLNDTDIDGDLTFPLVVTEPTKGDLSVENDGSFTYTPNANANGSDSFTYRVSDGAATSDPVTVALTVTPVADAPVADTESYGVAEDGVLIVDAPGVLDGDTDADGDQLTAVVTDGPDHGTLALAPDGGFTYTPESNYAGPDAFTYTASDGGLSSLPTGVAITVRPVGDAPVAVDDAASVAEDGELVVAGPGVLGNDGDADGDPLTAELVAGATRGSVSLGADGGYRYSPAADAHGIDTFTYRADDGQGGVPGAPATVTITVSPVPDAPRASGDAYTVAEDTALVVAAPGVLANDADPDGDSITAVVVAGPTHGTLDLTANGALTYTPRAGYHGPDSFTYRASDGSRTSGITTVALAVSPADDGAVAVDDAYATPVDVPLSVAAPGVLGNDTDVDGDGLTATVVEGPDRGQLTLSADGSFTYTPDSGYEGVASFTYRARGAGVDDAGDVAQVVVTVGNPNAAPIALDDAQLLDEDTPLTVSAPGVLGNDSDGDGDPLTAALVAGPTQGTLDLAPGGGFTYTPAANFHGTDTFTYRASDGRAASGIATVTLTVRPVNDAPSAVGETATVAEDALLGVAAPGVLANDVDLDGDTVWPVLVAGATNGAVQLANDGSFIYTPAANYSGPDSFSYHVTDGAATSRNVNVTLTVTPVNDAPTGATDTLTVAEDASFTTPAPGLLTNDGDVDSSLLTVAVASGPARGVLALQPDGSLTYTPAANYAGPDGFTYRVSDGEAQSAPVTVTIAVTPVNDAPTATTDSHSTPEDTLLDVPAPGVLGNDADVDGDVLTATLDGPPAKGVVTLRPNGSFSYAPTANVHGTDAFTYRVTDGTAPSAPVTVQLTITPVADAPVAGGDSYATAEDTALTIDEPGVLANDADADGDALELEQLTPAGHGTVALEPTGAFVYTPANGFAGADSFTYRTGDGATWSPPATVSISVGPVHDAPTTKADFAELPEDQSVTVDVLANDLPGDPGRVLSLSSVTGALHGAASVQTGRVRYQPPADWHGVEQLSYEACDDATPAGCASGSLQVVVVPVNDRPVAAGDAFALDEDSELTVTGALGVLKNDVDADGDRLVAVVTGSPTKGTLDLSPNGGFTYRPQGDVNGTDTFAYAPHDGTEAGTPATVTITIRPVVDPPTAQPDSATTPEDTSVLIDVLANDVVGDAGKTLVLSAVGAPSAGTAAIEGGRIRYAPAGNRSGSDALTYTLCQAGDTAASCVTGDVSLTVTPVNDRPVAVADSYALDRTAALDVGADSGVLANDSDVDGPSLTAALIGGPAHGSVTLRPDGSFRYVPAAQFSGADSFTYRASDGSATSDVVTVGISVRALNSRPVAAADAYSTMQRNALVRATPGVLGNDVDVDGNALRVDLVTNVGSGALDLRPDGSFNYLPNPDFAGVDRFEYRITDGELVSEVVAVTIAVAATPVPQAPPIEVQTGYWLAGGDGGVFSYGDAPFYGSTGDMRLNKPVVGIVSTTSGNGYWLVASDGGIFSFGDAEFFGSTGSMVLNQPVVGMVPTPTGKGYWLVARDGGIFAFGDAEFFGSTGSMVLNQPVVGMVPTASGSGYWMVARDGGIFAFGDAPFLGSTGDLVLNRPIVAMVARPTGHGYWMVATDGGIFAFGDAAFRGSTGDRAITAPVISMAPTKSGNGYWIVGADGAVYAFGDAGFYRGPDGQVTPIAGAVPNPNGTGLVLADEKGAAFSFGASEFTDGAPPLKLNAPMIGLALRPER